MKKYIEPKIKAVELDSDQAILNVCKVGGVYLASTTYPVGAYVCFGIGGVYPVATGCPTLGKKTSVTGSVESHPAAEAESIPS